MKKFLVLSISLILTNCSINNDSQNLTENLTISNTYEEKITKILKKKDDITTMTFEEYEIYMDDFTKKSNYPDLSK